MSSATKIVLDFKNLQIMLKRLMMACRSHHPPLPYHIEDIPQTLLTI